MSLSPEDFGASFKSFMDQMASSSATESPIAKRLAGHFAAELTGLPIVSESFANYEHPNAYLAVRDWLGRDGRRHELIGLSCGMGMFDSLSLKDIVASAHATNVKEVPIEYVNVAIDEGQTLGCVRTGLYLVGGDDGHKCAVMLNGPGRHPLLGNVGLEVMAADRPTAESVLAELRQLMRQRNIYQGHVLSVKFEDSGVAIEFTKLPKVERDGIILPSGLLERVERQTIEFAAKRDQLLRAGRHLKRGVLLYGPPGTGKTLTAMYLATAMVGRTVILLTGRALGGIKQTCTLARALAPATVIVEDVDLIAEDRGLQPGCSQPLLFELLNEMDGLGEDSDILFLLTTNEPRRLEPALASRPGRIDLAVEIPLPDADCRRRLLERYAVGLALCDVDWQPFVERTRGASAAFLRELLRRAALFGADGSSDTGIAITQRHVDEALRDLIVYGGEMQQQLLGFRPAETHPRPGA